MVSMANEKVLTRPGDDRAPFSADANRVFWNVIDLVQESPTQYAHFARVFANQGGSAAVIAEFASTLMESRAMKRYFKPSNGLVSEEGVKVTIAKQETTISVPDLQSILETVVHQANLSQRGPLRGGDAGMRCGGTRLGEMVTRS